MAKIRPYIIILIILACLGEESHAQIITQAEYFIDVDLGVGNNTPITITNGSLIDENFTAATSGLAPGTYTIHIRAKDDNNVWGFTEAREFLVKTPADVTPDPIYDVAKLEYFINNDPGVGSGVDIPITQGSVVDPTGIVLSTDTLPSGYHTLGIRAQNTNGDWGMYELRQIYVAQPTSIGPPVVYNISDIEYFFDEDPGLGQATQWPSFIQNNELDLNEILSESSTLSDGQHTLVVRGKNVNGDWGFYERRQVLIKTDLSSNATLPNIVKMEYYFDGNDPGVGNATELAITPGTLIDLDPVDIPSPGTLADGEHTFSIRAQDENGIWSMVEMDTFDVLDDCMQPLASFDSQLACAGSVVIFNNTSTNLQGDATYRWYLDGDAVIDETTQNTSFTYPFPGTYVVALAVRQGTICLDSIATTIEIQPQPVAVFSTSGGGINQPTTFAASASNLPTGAVWEWDFDGDFTVDDNTAGNTTYTYTSEGTFNPVLTVTDNNGCFVSVTNPITISSGGGSSPPFVDFLAGSNCVGNSVSFVDISQNLPAGSTYSWDFDGDGTEDSSTSGSTNFAFADAGTYTSQLTIDLGGSTISASKAIDIVDVPIVDFSANDVCVDTPMEFADLSTPGSGSNVYMWDFDNDGIVDSNASSAIAFTYTTPGTHVVTLKIANGFGCETSVIKQVNVLAVPQPNFDWNQVCAGEPVIFNDLSINAISGASYSWDFDGDGTEDSSTADDEEFTYSAKGIYNVSLTIENITGCSATVTKSVEVYDIPEVAIDINARCYGQESEMLDISQKVDPNASYYWDFESDGIIDDTTVGSTNFTYDSYNSYLVTLTIDNGGNCRSSVESLVQFADAATPDFETNKLCEGEEVIFTNLSTDLNPAAIYSWDFNGDGSEDSAFPGSTAHIYPDAGTYDATLTIDNGGNCLAYKTIPLEITPPPDVDLGPDEILCEEGTVSFDAGIGYISYLWPDGSTDQTYTVDEIGEYIVKVQDAKLCFNSDTVAVKLLGPPEPAFEYSFDLSFQGIRVLFENTSANATSYSWDFGEGSTSTEVDPSFVFGDYSFYQTSIYDVCLTAINDCNELTFCEEIFVSPTAVYQDAGDIIDIFPVPANDLVSIVLDPQESYKDLSIINGFGQKLWTAQTNEYFYEINVKEFAQGIYYFVAETENGQLYKKLMKE